MIDLKLPSPPAKDAGMEHAVIGSARTARGLALAALLTLPILAACQSTEPLGRIVTPSKIQPSDPPLNPNPTHIVRLHGRAPETLWAPSRSGPWLEAWPMVIDAAQAGVDGGYLMLLDGTGQGLPMVGDPWLLLALTGNAAATVVAEWTPWGLEPLTAWNDYAEAVSL
jgi:hypothetical protein